MSGEFTSERAAIHASVSCVGFKSRGKPGTLLSRLCGWVSETLVWQKRQTVALLRVSGVIGKVYGKSGLTFEDFESSIDKAFSVCRCKAVVLVVNSPGGSPVQCEMIAEKILRLSQEKDIPVYAFAEDLAASAGYWLLCAGSQVYASKNSLVGSIGVVAAGFGFTDLMKKAGVERRLYYEGKHKVLFDPFSEPQPQNIEIIRQMQRDIYNSFTEFVKERRGHALSSDASEEIFSGRLWTGESALAVGLIDGVALYSRFIAENFGTNAKVVKIKQRNRSWMAKLLAFFTHPLSERLSGENNLPNLHL